MTRKLLLTFILLLFASPVMAESIQELITQGDSLYAGRHEGHTRGLASSRPIDQAITIYRNAIEIDPNSIEAKWKFLRANYFKGAMSDLGIKPRQEIFDEGRQVGEVALQVLGKKVGKDNLWNVPVAEQVSLFKGNKDVAPLYFWLGVNWGEWSEAFGKLNAVMKGAAGKIKTLGEVSLAINPSYEEGGPYRLLGRLHHQTPRVPIFTGWASNEEARKYLEKAIKVGPYNKINHFFLGELLLDLGEKPAAKRQMGFVLDKPIRKKFKVEEAEWQKKAKKNLRSWG